MVSQRKGEDSPLNIENVEDLIVKEPMTAEDHIVLALDKVGCEEVVRILRDWSGSRVIRRSLNKLHHRDPVDRFTHARRHAVAIYAESIGMRPANLMVAITGKNERKHPKRSERYKLQRAREALQNDEDALIGAMTLAAVWKRTRPSNVEHWVHLQRLIGNGEL